MNKIVLSVEGLTKIYSNKQKQNKALNDITFSVKQGEVFGLLGPNGAGKTTFLSILAGTVEKTQGKINVWGFDLDKNPRQVRASIGIVPQEVNLDAFFSPKSLLELQAGLYGVTKKDRITNIILKMVSLEKQAKAPDGKIHSGMTPEEIAANSTPNTYSPKMEKKKGFKGFMQRLIPGGKDGMELNLRDSKGRTPEEFKALPFEERKQHSNELMAKNQKNNAKKMLGGKFMGGPK